MRAVRNKLRITVCLLIMSMLMEAVPLKAVLPLCVYASCETVSSDVMLTEEETALGAAQDLTKFPESYRSLLLKLQKSHPAWQYEAYPVDVNWDTVVENELKNDRSWIEGSAKAEYVDKDNPRGSGWYLATRAGVEFYMDPRNYLDETHIFAFERQTYNESYQTKEAVSGVLKGTFMSGAIPGEDMSYAEAFCRTGALSNVNASPLFLASRVKQEQGSKGEGDLISGKYPGYEGYYNYFNIQATGSGKQAVVNGLKYASTGSDFSRPWNTRYKSIKGGAEYIAGLYIKKGQDSIYLQKFNVAYEPYYNHQYMQNVRAPMAESATVAASYSSAGITGNAFVFRIPVFKNMPGDSSSGGDDPGGDDPGGGDPGGEDPGNGDKKVDITLDKPAMELKTGQIQRLGLSVSPFVEGISLSSFMFASSDDSCVMVDKEGYVHALKASDKPVNITVSYGTGDNASKVMLTTAVTDCVVSVFDAEGAKQSELRLSYNDRPYEHLEKISSTGKGDIFAGYFTKAGGQGFRVDEDYIVKGDMEIHPFYVNRKKVSANELTVLPIGDRYFSADPVKPGVDVYCNGKHLTPGTDYKATFKKNKNVGLAGVTIRGKGEYKGLTGTSTFKIYPVYFDYGLGDIRDANGAFKEGKKVFAKPIVRYWGRNLRPGKDYSIDYPQKNTPGGFQKKSLYGIKLTFMGNYEGEAFCYERIADPPVYKVRLSSLKGSTVTGVADVPFKQSDCAGHYRPSRILVNSKNGTALTEGLDYCVSFKEDTAPGRGSVVIRGIGNYTGTLTKKYKILP